MFAALTVHEQYIYQQNFCRYRLPLTERWEKGLESYCISMMTSMMLLLLRPCFESTYLLEFNILYLGTEGGKSQPECIHVVPKVKVKNKNEYVFNHKCGSSHHSKDNSDG